MITMGPDDAIGFRVGIGVAPPPTGALVDVKTGEPLATGFRVGTGVGPVVVTGGCVTRLGGIVMLWKGATKVKQKERMG